MSQIKLSENFIKSNVKLALNEDLYPSGDITSGLIKNNKIIEAKLVSNQDAVIGGLLFVKYAFLLIDKKIKFIKKKKDGSFVRRNSIIAIIKGNKKKSPWIICIENPDNQNSKPIECLSKKDNEKYMAVATSGDYRNFFTIDNKRYSHTIDPKTGFPISNNLTSVSVALPGQFRHAGDADALATALNVMGLKEGFKFAVNNSIAALFIFRSEGEFSIRMTPSFEDIIH